MATGTIVVFMSNYSRNHYIAYISGLPKNMSSLKQLFVVFRHGSKVPASVFLQEEDKNVFKDYAGQLTNEGKMSMFRLGQSIRRRYDNFIGANYDSKKFVIGSTPLDRTLMSAQCFNLGLFPPTGDQIWNPEIMWQPIPVFPLEFSDGGALGALVEDLQKKSEDECKALLNLKSESLQKTLGTYIKYMEDNCGSEDPKNMTRIFNLDDLTTMTWHKLAVPAAFVEIETDIFELKSMVTKAMSDPSTSCGKSIVALMFKSFLKRITGLESDSSACSTSIYSEHDLQVWGIMMALADEDIPCPLFGAYVILEVHEAADSNLEPEVHMMYSYTSEAPPQRIIFKKNKSDSISLSQFKTILQEYLADC